MTPLALAVRIASLERERRDLELLAIAAAVDGQEFSAAELLDRAQVDADLRFVLQDARTPKQVGRRLMTLAIQTTIAAVRLVRIDRNGAGCIWVVEIHPDAGVLPDVDV